MFNYTKTASDTVEVQTRQRSDTVEVQTRQRTNGTINGFLDIPCRRGAQASGSLFQRRRFVFYCAPNSNIDNGPRKNEHQHLIGRLAQNILVTVNTLQVLRLAEIEVYENQDTVIKFIRLRLKFDHIDGLQDLNAVHQVNHGKQFTSQ